MKYLLKSIFFLTCFIFATAGIEIIPRKVFFSNNNYSSLTLSPDGNYLAYLSPYYEEPGFNGSRNIFVKSLPNGKPKRLTGDRADSISFLQFAYDNRTVFYTSDPNGDETYVLNMVNVITMKIQNVENDSNAQSSVWKLSPKHPFEIVLKTNKRNPAFFDAYSFNIKTGLKSLIYENNFFINLLFDFDLKPAIGYNQTKFAGQMFYRLLDGGKRVELIKESPPATRDSTKPLNIDYTGNSYWFDNDFSDKIQLVSFEKTGRIRKVLYSGKKTDVEEVVFHPTTGRPLFAYENYMKSETVYDFNFPLDFANIKHNLPEGSTVRVKGLSLDLRRWLVSAEMDNTPPKYYLYDRKNGTVKFLLSVNEALANRTLDSTYPVEIPISDGLVEVCYIVLPVDYDLWKNGTPSKPLPTVLFVRGGPRDRDYWEYDKYSQYLANRNYGVLKCNFRGSVGFGKTFANAGNGEMGRKMQQDLTDSVHWAIENKISDPQKVSIVGYSYGGYATLAELAFTSDLYACGIDVVGPSNMISQMQSIPAYWKPRLAALKLLISAGADSEEGLEKLLQISPFFYTDQIKKPLLIGHGAIDRRVKRNESDRIFEALKNNNVSVTYVSFANEGHGFKHAENNIAFWAIAEKFLGDYLGGRVEPVTDEFEFSTEIIQSNN